jgi:hypothetical protein
MKNISKRQGFLVLEKWFMLSLLVFGMVVFGGSFVSAEEEPPCPPPEGNTLERVDGDGDDKKDDWLMDSGTDDKGNVWELICLKRGDTTDESFLALRYKPGGQDGKWFGKCSFCNGDNYFLPSVRPDSNNNDVFSKLIWTNYNRVSEEDWEYEYHPQKDELIIYETTHKKDGDPCGKNNGPKPHTITSRTEVFRGPAPPKPEDLHPKSRMQPSEPCSSCYGVGSESFGIPTLTEWGMIIFCVLLFGWMAWVIVRRRRRVTVDM